MVDSSVLLNPPLSPSRKPLAVSLTDDTTDSANTTRQWNLRNITQ